MSQLKNLEQVFFFESVDINSLKKQAYGLYKQLKTAPKEKSTALKQHIKSLKTQANKLLKQKSVKESKDSDSDDKKDKDEKPIGKNYKDDQGNMHHDGKFDTFEEFDQWFMDPNATLHLKF